MKVDLSNQKLIIFLRVLEFIEKIFNAWSYYFLYYLSIGEVDTRLENQFEILSFNIQLIIIYFWTLKKTKYFG